MERARVFKNIPRIYICNHKFFCFKYPYFLISSMGNENVKIGQCDTCGSRYMRVKMVNKEVSDDSIETMYRIECALCGQLIIVITNARNAVIHHQHFPYYDDLPYKGYLEHRDAMKLKQIRKALKTVPLYRIRCFFHTIKELIIKGDED